MPKKGEHLDKQHREAMSLAMKKFWADMSPEEKAERIANWVGSTCRPELADLPSQLEKPQEYRRGYQKLYRETHPRILCMGASTKIETN